MTTDTNFVIRNLQEVLEDFSSPSRAVNTMVAWCIIIMSMAASLHELLL